MRRAKMFSVLPTLLTLGNGACGFGAITFAAKVGFDQIAGHELFFSGLLIFLGMLFDMLDGSVARWTKQTSDFGGQLDSLCDAITFGVAPAFLMLQFQKSKIGVLADGIDSSYFTYPPRFLWVIAVLFALCALLRLARFNVETDDDDSHEYFSGLPSPAAAATVASFAIAMQALLRINSDLDQRIADRLAPVAHVILPIVTLAVAFLMVSRFRYSHVFNQFFRGQRSRVHVITVVAAVAAVFLAREALPVIFCAFAFAPPIQWAWRELVNRPLYKSREV